MNTNPTMLSPWQSQLLAILRIVIGYMFLLHGCAKLLHTPHVAMFDNLELFSLIGLAASAILLVMMWGRPQCCTASCSCTWPRRARACGR